MPLQQRLSKPIRSFDVPVSYRVNEARLERLRDALNVMSNQGRLETRFGRSLYNSVLLSGSAQSISFFKHTNGTNYLIAKVGTVLYAVQPTGAHTVLKTGLTASAKHRGLTWARGSSSRHIISVEGDGLFQFNGTIFTQLGQDVPAAPTATSSNTAGTLSLGSYSVYLTYYSSITGFESNASAATAVTVSASKVIQDLTYTSKKPGAIGNLISVTYTAGGALGSETVAVTNNNINVTMATASTTANQIKSVIEASAAANALVSVAVTGTGTTAQVAAAAAFFTNGNQAIALTGIPTTAANTTIDTVNIYIKQTGSAANATYIGAVSLGTSTFNITTDSVSTQIAPIANAKLSNGGGKYLAEFNRRLVYAGSSSYKSDVFFSQQDLPDAFNDGTASNRLVLSVPGDGEITGLACGLYDNAVLTPFLVVFKKRSTYIYSENLGDQTNGKFTPISNQIGCVSNETIRVKNGVVYFLSDRGFFAIQNGRLVVSDTGNVATLGMGDIDDIFKQAGYVYAVNKTQLSNAFSVYYSAMDQYLTWVPEGSGTSLSKTYNYEFASGGFKPYQFFSSSTAACTGEDSSGDEVVFMSDTDGAVYTHSLKEARSDADSTGTAQAIDTFAMMTWIDGGDMDASYNFRELLLRRVVGGGDLTVKTWVNYNISDVLEAAYSLTSSNTGPLWDTAIWDTDVWSDERTIVTARKDINRVGENMLIGFYQKSIGTNISLISAQLDFSKNGNRN